MRNGSLTTGYCTCCFPSMVLSGCLRHASSSSPMRQSPALCHRDSNDDTDGKLNFLLHTYTFGIVSHGVVLLSKPYLVFVVSRSLVTRSVLQKYIAFIFLLLLFVLEGFHLPLTNDISCFGSSCLPSLRFVGTFNSTNIHPLRFQWPITSSVRIDWILWVFLFFGCRTRTRYHCVIHVIGRFRVED